MDMSGVRTPNCSAEHHLRRTDRARYGTRTLTLTLTLTLALTLTLTRYGEYERTEDYVLCRMYEDALGYGPHLMHGREVPNDAEPGLACLFGEPALAVPASITSESQIECPTPPLTQLQATIRVRIWVRD